MSYPTGIPPLVVPREGSWLLGSYDTDEEDALVAFSEGRSAYDPDLGDDDGER